jgi:hypothetical protein
MDGVTVVYGFAIIVIIIGFFVIKKDGKPK